MDSKYLVEFTQMLVLIEESCGSKCSEQMKTYLWSKFKGLDRDKVMNGLSKVLDEWDSYAKKFPPVGTFTKAIEGNHQDKSDQGLIQAEKAADKVLWAVKYHGRYKPVCFDDPFVNSTLKGMGGWTRLCDMPPSEYKWWRKDFIESYLRNRRAGNSSVEKLNGGHGGHVMAIGCDWFDSGVELIGMDKE